MRRVFASASSAPAYGYDPYGNPLQGTAPLTDFGYAGMFTNADSGLYLTLFRASDPVAGRWLSRDPIGEVDSSWNDGRGGEVNLYAYVNNDPIYLRDPSGLFATCFPGEPGGTPGGFAPIEPAASADDPQGLKQAADAAKEAGPTTREEKRAFHNAITKQGITDYQELVEIARSVRRQRLTR